MYKCGDKFCSNPSRKTESDVRNCSEEIAKNVPGWNTSRCFWNIDGAGCKECGSKVARASACVICTSCGWSPCG